MTELYKEFPNIKNDKVIIRKMIEEDVDNLSEITNNDLVYQYIPYFLYKKSKKTLLTAIRNLGDRDFKKKKCIIAGIYLVDHSDKLIGLAELFDYKVRADKITIGYLLNEDYWNQGVSTSVVSLMLDYLFNEIGINCVQAFVMPENIYSSRVLLKNGFKKEDKFVQEKNWGGKDCVELEVYTIYKEEYPYF